MLIKMMMGGNSPYEMSAIEAVALCGKAVSGEGLIHKGSQEILVR